MHDSSHCPHCRASTTPGSMSDAEFASFLGVCRSELAAMQSEFQKRISGGGRWFYDLADCTLQIGSQSFPITPIGTYSAERQSWLWAWANDEFPATARAASRRIQLLHTITGFRIFVNPGTGASSSDADNFAAMAVHCIGGIGLFRIPGSPTLLLAVHQPDLDVGKVRH